MQCPENARRKLQIAAWGRVFRACQDRTVIIPVRSQPPLLMELTEIVLWEFHTALTGGTALTEHKGLPMPARVKPEEKEKTAATSTSTSTILSRPAIPSNRAAARVELEELEDLDLPVDVAKTGAAAAKAATVPVIAEAAAVRARAVTRVVAGVVAVVGRAVQADAAVMEVA